MGFQDSSENLAKVWGMIPEGVDILMTHGPPAGFGDQILLGKNVGCPELLKRVLAAKPRFHLFGHIHEVRKLML
jgi:Icc-related predicted phosphoesterase